jgi:hypothetical protein
MLLLPVRRFSFRAPLLLHAPRHRDSSGFRRISAHSNGTFYAELRARGFRLTLGMYDTQELATRAYDATAWRFWRPRRNLNFLEMESLVKAEFLVPPPRLIDNEDHHWHRHHQAQRRLAIAERDGRLVQ